MQKEIAVNTEVLSSDIENLQNLLNLIKNNMNKMFDEVEILDSMWDGPANEAFKKQFYQDHTDMDKLCNTVQKIIDFMTFAKNEYEKCENGIREIITTIRI